MTRSGQLSHRFVAVALLLAAGSLGIVAVQATINQESPQAAVSTAFTYQGRIVLEGVPAEGTCSLQFELWDAQSNGTMLGSVAHPAVPVTGGFFTTTLDFGNVFATGQQRFVEVSAQCPAGVGDPVLLGRQELTATPFAQWANHAPWSGLTGIPAGVVDPVPFAQVVVVAKSGGDFTTIQAAIDSITDADPNNKRYLVWVAPGIYQEKVTLKSGIEVRGAGVGATQIFGLGGATATSAAIVTTTGRAWLRSLSVVSVGDNQPFSIGVFVPQFRELDIREVRIATDQAATSSAILASGTVYAHDVDLLSYGVTVKTVDCAGCNVELSSSTISAIGGAVTGVRIQQVNAFAELRDLDIEVSGEGSVVGLDVALVNTTTYDDIRIIASGTTSVATSIGVNLSSVQVTFTGLNVVSRNGSTTVGLNLAASNATIRDAYIEVGGGTFRNDAIRHYSGSSPTIQRSTISASGALSRALTNRDNADTAIALVTINQSVIRGTQNSLGAFGNNITYRVGSSQLIGPKGGLGNHTCVASYDSNFMTLGPSC